MKRIYIPGDPERFRNYHRCVERCGGLCVDAESAEALLLPGGGDVEPWRYGEENRACNVEPGRDEEEFRLLDTFLGAGKPVLGICRGLQVINVYFGGTLDQDIPGHSQVEGRDRRHLTGIGPCVLRTLYGGEMEVNSAHHQALGRIAECFTVIQHSDDGVLEGMIHNTLPIIGLQWHPERMTGAHRREDTVDGIKIFEFFLKLIRGEETLC